MDAVTVNHGAASASVQRIVIVGLGPRGLLVLERLLALAPYAPQRRFELEVFEPNEPGVGVHDRNQPDYLMLNTIACQLSMFPDHAALGGLPERRGASFYDWCLMRGVHVKTGSGASASMRLCRAGDFLPRRLLGDYLAWTWRTLATSLPFNVTLRVHAQRAVRVEREVDGARYLVHGEEGVAVSADRLFLTLGHTGRLRAPAAPREIARPYPLPQAVAPVADGESVAVAGFGLAAMDVLAALTVGRGGRHERTADGCRYHRCGREPAIVLYSRSGLPFHARPEAAPQRPRHQPLFASRAAIAALRADGRRIDFEAEVLPLMRHEMRAAYYLQCVELAGDGAAEAQALRQRLRQAHAGAALETLFERLAQRHGAFDPARYLAFAAPPGLTGDAYVRWVRDSLRADLAASALGCDGSPLKAALEVWRDLRDVLRDMAADQGLDAPSLHRFFGPYSALINRLVAGPQKERIEELLALVEAGVVEIFPGPNPDVRALPGGAGFELTLPSRERTHIRRVDHLVRAQLDAAGLHDSDAPLLRDMLGQGLLAPVTARPGPDAVASDSGGRVPGLPAALAGTLWVFGPNAEGASYYNHYVPSSGAWSRAFSDAHRAAAECMGIALRPAAATACAVSATAAIPEAAAPAG